MTIPPTPTAPVGLSPVANAAHSAPASSFSVDAYAWFWPILAVTTAACELLWRLAPRKPFVVELQRRTGLNPRVFQSLTAVQDEKALQLFWRDALPHYHYTLLVGRLVLESPLLPLFQHAATSDTLTPADIDELIDASVEYVHETTPLIERWLIGDYESTGGQPADEAHRPKLTAWATRRTALETYFHHSAPDLTQLVEAFYDRPAAAPPPPPTRNMPPGPSLKYAFTAQELASIQRLLTFMPKIGELCPFEPLPAAINALSSFQPPANPDALLDYLRQCPPNEPDLFALTEILTIFQALSAAMALLKAAVFYKQLSQWVQTLGYYARQPQAAEELRPLRNQLYLLFRNPTARAALKDEIHSLTNRLSQKLANEFSRIPAVTYAQVELLDLKKISKAVH